VHETKIHDIDDLQKRLMQTCLDFDRKMLAWLWPSDIMCVCWWWPLWTHAPAWMFIYMIHQNILWNCQC